MGMPMDMWFDELIDEFPEAVKYRSQVRNLVDMYWQEAEERVKFEEEIAVLKALLEKAEARAIGVEARRKHGLDLTIQMFDRGSSYTNLIMSAGYAALIAAWSTSYNDLNPSIAKWIGGLALISLLAFISWEVFKMLYVAALNRKLAIALSPDKDTMAELDNFNITSRAWGSRLHKTWIFSLLLTIPTGLISGALLIWEMLVSTHF